MNKNILIFSLLLGALFTQACMSGKLSKGKVGISGELKLWHTLTLTFDGAETSEQDLPNPFLNYRLLVSFTNGDKTHIIPGFYAADGNAANTGATGGNKWQVRFTPDRTGTWSYKVSFREGKNIAISDSAETGKPLACDGTEGSFNVTDSDKTGTDFRARGRLNYVNKPYLKFEQSGEYFLKWGADSPENMLAYYEFDQTPAKHYFEPHSGDWKEGDPSWQKNKGKNIIGALNYLSGKGINGIYFLTMNVMGDGNDVWMWTDRDERYRYDCSKLDQWEIVFEHAQKMGIMLHFVTQEIENQCLLDIGALDTQRKLYYRELVARYGHHLAITWNLGEENGPNKWTMAGQTEENRLAMAEYLRRISPYKNFEVVHTMPADPERKDLMDPFLGKPYLDGISLQVGNPRDVHRVTRQWLKFSADSSRPWVTCIDEIGPWRQGALPDAVDPGHDTIRSYVLWGNLMAGGAGGEWYFGKEDLVCEDWRTRDKLWDQSRIALEFFRSYLPFAEMKSMDELTSASNDYCFAEKGKIYAIYLPGGGATNLDLRGAEGTFDIKWFNPRTGGELTDSGRKAVKGNAIVSTGNPPVDEDKDWVVLITNSNP